MVLGRPGLAQIVGGGDQRPLTAGQVPHVTGVI